MDSIQTVVAVTSETLKAGHFILVIAFQNHPIPFYKKTTCGV